MAGQGSSVNGSMAGWRFSVYGSPAAWRGDVDALTKAISSKLSAASGWSAQARRRSDNHPRGRAHEG
eukprot:11734227-Heterocapsa_arctica.AAC.1